MAGVGDPLREARLSRGLTHEYISQIIKIRPEFLEALEEENYSAIPGSFYAKTFLRRYADFLGLDSDGLVERFVEQERASAEQATQAVALGQAAATRRAIPRLNYGVVGGVAILLIALAVIVYEAVASPHGAGGGLAGAITPTVSRAAFAGVATPTSAPQIALATPTPTKAAHRAPTARVKSPKPTPARKPRPTRTPTPTPTNTPRPTKTPTPTPTATPTTTPTPTPTPRTTGAVVARIRTTSPASVTVRADGRVVFSGTIRPGEVRTFGADRLLYVYSSSAPHVLVSVNGCVERTLDSYACPGCPIAYYNFPSDYQSCRR